MTQLAKATNLVAQKTMLADKHDRLIKSISSKPRRERYRRQAATYRRQAEDLRRLVKGLAG